MLVNWIQFNKIRQESRMQMGRCSLRGRTGSDQSCGCWLKLERLVTESGRWREQEQICSLSSLVQLDVLQMFVSVKTSLWLQSFCFGWMQMFLHTFTSEHLQSQAECESEGRLMESSDYKLHIQPLTYIILRRRPNQTLLFSQNHRFGFYHSDVIGSDEAPINQNDWQLRSWFTVNPPKLCLSVIQLRDDFLWNYSGM